MARNLSILSATILILVNFIFSSSAFHSFDTIQDQDGGVVVLTVKDIASKASREEHLLKGVGSGPQKGLRLGSLCSKDSFWMTHLEIDNKESEVIDFPIEIYVADKRNLHYLSVLNVPGYDGNIFVQPDPFDFSKAKFYIRIKPFTVSKVEVLVAAH